METVRTEAKKSLFEGPYVSRDSFESPRRLIDLKTVLGWALLFSWPVFLKRAYSRGL